MNYQSKYALWARVTLEGNISAVITCIQFSDTTQYKLEWFASGTKHSEWFFERELDEFAKGNQNLKCNLGAQPEYRSYPTSDGVK